VSVVLQRNAVCCSALSRVCMVFAAHLRFLFFTGVVSVSAFCVGGRESVWGWVCVWELQCVAVCCSVLQCVAVCCSVLQCVAVCCVSESSHMCV